MKNLILLVLTLSLASLSSAAVTSKNTKKGPNRKTASSIMGTASYTGPNSSCGATGPCTASLSVTGDAANAIYEQMSAVTTNAATKEKKSERGIDCTVDGQGVKTCSWNFVDIRQGILDGACSKAVDTAPTTASSPYSGKVQYSKAFCISYGATSPCAPTGPAGPLIISGPAADHLYADMKISPPDGDTSQEKPGNGIVCKKDVDGNNFCTIDFGDISTGQIQGNCN